ncbi:2OG-Fe(II) oxygenase family protein [Falsiruegeria litorea]|uniref:2OG-Fe(II) oxygenase n=2 Tax=Roseobacteraceae TaxID=2854170 RepID=A0ABS5WWH2_9RHOB|nr:2OG-Fe(II) oxygenase family protein [Falsiruegeria litorea]MBT3142858.1 2OG-Fe(II) oxygenase [Falsiruegeria litorea]MBT8167216.1 2OG-Fe(II) oxygenase [Falsiruegeria litorea]
MAQNSLARARSVQRPTRQEMLQRAPSVQHFWEQNKDLFQDAWKEWDGRDSQRPILDRSLYDPKLRDAVEQAWKDPGKEIAVKELWKEVLPNVYEAQFFDPDRLSALRDYLANVADADIPLRPPYGISLNRGGAMLDSRSAGYIAAPSFQAFYRDLMNVYMRPISRLLFPDTIGYDTQTFGFSIQWQADADTSLRAHTDASSVTLNLNLNLPGEDFSGSGVRFFDPKTRQVAELSFAPGTALIHHGSVPHESMPITKGERSNIVLWLYGDRGQVPRVGGAQDAIPAKERWTVPPTLNDGFAPF